MEGFWGLDNRDTNNQRCNLFGDLGRYVVVDFNSLPREGQFVGSAVLGHIRFFTICIIGHDRIASFQESVNTYEPYLGVSTQPFSFARKEYALLKLPNTPVMLFHVDLSVSNGITTPLLPLVSLARRKVNFCGPLPLCPYRFMNARGFRLKASVSKMALEA